MVHWVHRRAKRALGRASIESLNPAIFGATFGPCSRSKRTKGARIPAPFVFQPRAARGYFDAAASCLMAPDIMRTRVASLAPLA